MLRAQAPHRELHANFFTSVTRELNIDREPNRHAIEPLAKTRGETGEFRDFVARREHLSCVKDNMVAPKILATLAVT